MTHLVMYAAPAALAGMLSLLLTPLTIVLGRRWGLLDAPGARKVHQDPTPRVGGLAIALSVLSASSVAVAGWPGVFGANAEAVWVALAASGVVALLGLLDDAWQLPSQVKLLGLVAAATAVAAGGLSIDRLSFGNGLTIDLGWGDWPLTVLWIVGITVALNFIDGLDGLAAGIAAIAAATLAVVCAGTYGFGAAALAFTLTAALAGFLVYNTYPARVFMGDSGSLFVGFVLACACLLANAETGAMKGLLVPVLALSVPILDTASTLVRRGVLQRRSMFSAERGHIHHRLLDLGLSHRHAVFALYGLTLAAGGVGLLALLNRGWATAGGVAMIVPLMLVFFRLTGSIRTRQIIAAIRRNRQIERESRRYRAAFEEMQVRFPKATSFGEWWECLCGAAETLDFAELTLPVARRDGTPMTLTWRRSEAAGDDLSACIRAAVPIRHRRAGEPLRAEVVVKPGEFLECAGRRVALFSRLIAEHSLADLPEGRAASKSRLYKNGIGGRRTDAPGVDRTDPAALARHAVSILEPGRRVAIVHDFLYCYGGAERVLEQMLAVFPDADLFSLFDFLPDDERDFIGNKPVKTTFIQKLPFARNRHRGYLPLMPFAIEQLDVTGYDLVISSSYLAAKGVITGPDQLHVCYCHSPVRYAWDLQHQYLAQSHLGWTPRAIVARSILHYIRNWDVRSSTGVDAFVSNSDFVARRIEKAYRRKATTVYPPVAVEDFSVGVGREDYYLTASRMVPYKRIDLIVEAFNRMPGRRLIVIGNGPEWARISAMAGPNVRLVGHQPSDRLRRYMQLAKGFVFAAEEDFGIVPVEAQACGTPVIALGRGGAVETVLDGRTGVLFPEQTVESLVDAVERFESLELAPPHAIREHAERFGSGRFREAFAGLVAREWLAFQLRRTPAESVASVAQANGHAGGNGNGNGNGHAAGDPVPALS